jgi:hypothetical protein
MLYIYIYSLEDELQQPLLMFNLSSKPKPAQVNLIYHLPYDKQILVNFHMMLL